MIDYLEIPSRQICIIELILNREYGAAIDSITELATQTGDD